MNEPHVAFTGKLISHLLSLSLSPSLLIYTSYPGYILVECTEQLVTGTLQVEGFLHVDKKGVQITKDSRILYTAQCHVYIHP